MKVDIKAVRAMQRHLLRWCPVCQRSTTQARLDGDDRWYCPQHEGTVPVLNRVANVESRSHAQRVR